MVERVQSFLNRQQRQLRELSFKGYLRQKWERMTHASGRVLGMAVTLPVYLTLRVVDLFIPVRFVPIRTERIGHLVANTEVYLSERDAGMHDRGLDVFYRTWHIANSQVYRMVKRVVFIMPLGRFLVRWDKNLSESRHCVTTCDRDFKNALALSDCHFRFSEEELARGRQELAGMGIPEGADIVCLHNRDSGYLDAKAEEQHWDYHDYRDADINNYRRGAEFLLAKGAYVVRMGAVVDRPIGIERAEFVELALAGHRTELLDVYLPSICRFFVSSSAGINALPMVFGKPLVVVNAAPFGHVLSWHSDCIAIPKLYRSRKDGRLLSFREIVGRGLDELAKGEDFQANGVEAVENSETEILETIKEMQARLDGEWEESPDDKVLQERARDIVRTMEKHCETDVVFRYGAYFLRKYQHLLN